MIAIGLWGLFVNRISVRDFGALGSGTANDTAAIQKAIDSAKPGAEIFFPKGTYLVSIDPKDRRKPAIIIRSNLSLNGKEATIRLERQQGDYSAMIGPNPSWKSVEDFSIENLTIDQNGADNLVPKENGTDTLETARHAVRIYPGKNIRIRKCRFVNSNSANTITVNGGERLSDVIIENCEFSSIGDNPFDFDHSTIYTNGSKMTIRNNTFKSKRKPPSNGVRTAIEIHGTDQVVEGNRIEGFFYGMNVTGYSDLPSKNQVYRNNTIKDCRVGFVLWAYKKIQKPELANIRFENNSIEINLADWNGSYEQAAGFELEPNGDADMTDLLFFRNKITFSNFGTPRPEWSRFAAFHLQKYENGEPTMRNWTFRENQIADSIASPFHLGANNSGFQFERNLIEYSQERKNLKHPIGPEVFRAKKDLKGRDVKHQTGLY